MDTGEAFRIVKRPYVTEKTFELVERENKLVFIVGEKATKAAVKKAVETLYDMEVESVNVVSTVYGRKAYVRLAKGASATELATKLGLV